MATAVDKFPAWIKRPWPSGSSFEEVKSLLGGLQLHTVCQSARCPNQSECWGRGTATMMVLGNVCSRHCTYCSVHSGRPELVDAEEPEKVAEAVLRMKLKHTVLTSVTRDDLEDGGAGHIARTIEAVKRVNPGTTIEVLVQDFKGERTAIARVLAAGPDVFSHNIETVERLHPRLRDRRFTYQGALEVLRIAREIAPQGLIKSAFMLGCGETDAEVSATLSDLRNADCDAVSMGQYLQPTPRHHAVARYVPPEEFESWQEKAYALGFSYAVAGTFVRSSYRSEALIEARDRGHAHTGG